MGHQQLLADILTHGGSSITAITFISAMMRFFDEHYYGVLALCAIGGFILSILGYIWTNRNKKIIQKIKQEEYRIKQAERKEAELRVKMLESEISKKKSA